MMYGEIKSWALFNSENEKFIWQIIVSALIMDIPLILITTSQDKIIFVVIYLLTIFITAILFSIIKIVTKSLQENKQKNIKSSLFQKKQNQF